MTIDKARDLLEKHQMLCPEGTEVTVQAVSTCLHQIANTRGNGLTPLIKSLIRAAATLLDETGYDNIRNAAKEIVVEQLKDIYEDLASITEGVKSNIREEFNKHSQSLTELTKTLSKQIKPTPSYSDILSNGPPPNVNPKVVAREGIKARQFLVDCPPESDIHTKSQTEILKMFNAALTKAGAGAQEGKIRSVERLRNGGLLGEFGTDEGAKWLNKSTNANEFFTALGNVGNGAKLKPRSHNVIVYFAPLTFDPNGTEEILEANPILAGGGLIKARWAKPPQRRNPGQQRGHIILTVSSGDLGNELINKGFMACNRNLSVARCKKEPVRCLKCQGWNHFASECTQQQTCGTCGSVDHRTSDCDNTEDDKRWCRSCAHNSHSSWDRSCPTLIKQTEAYDEKHPENKLTFFPSTQAWTWQIEPPPLSPLPAQNVTSQSQTERTQSAQSTAVPRKTRQSQLNYSRVGPQDRSYARQRQWDSSQRQRTVQEQTAPPEILQREGSPQVSAPTPPLSYQ